MSQDSYRLHDSLFFTPEYQALFCNRAQLQRMLDFEAALARAEAKVGICSTDTADTIAKFCDAQKLDISALGYAAPLAGNLAIPLVKQLTALVENFDASAAKYVHWGATSQDVLDTGLVLQLRDTFDLIEKSLHELAIALIDLIERHRNTLMVGRTWQQHALPITLGLKAAGWLGAITRHRQRLSEVRTRMLTLQFGGAAGTLAALKDKGIVVALALAGELDLAMPAAPWHSQRDRVAEVATVLGLLAGTLGKIAHDVALCMQTDVGELAEPAAGRGGSSSMPHKRNPVACAVVLAAAARVPGLVSTMLSAMTGEHERSLGGWQAEWDTLPTIVMLTGGALQRMTQMLRGIEVNAQHMSDNLNRSNGLIMAEALTIALGKHLGRAKAHEIIDHACTIALGNGGKLIDVVSENPLIRNHFSVSELEALMKPENYLGATQEFIDRVLLEARANFN